MYATGFHLCSSCDDGVAFCEFLVRGLCYAEHAIEEKNVSTTCSWSEKRKRMKYKDVANHRLSFVSPGEAERFDPASSSVHQSECPRTAPVLQDVALVERGALRRRRIVVLHAR